MEFEPIRAFVPHALPPAGPPLAPHSYEDQNRAAETALARLAAVSGLVPSVADLFDHEACIALNNRDDVEEVTNHMRAFRMVRDNLHDVHGLPVNVRLICDAHGILLDGARGANKQPGQLRRSQNWIGGSRPGNAVFVPPPPEQVPQLLGDLERFIHAAPPPLPPLVIIALVHAQFETIRPFLDGNGRIGRLLITALLEHWSLLKEPLLYLSGYLKRNQREYYRLLSATRTDGAWEEWVSFFLAGISEAAAEAASGARRIAKQAVAESGSIFREQ